MKTTLTHIPPTKCQELQQIVQLLCKNPEIEMIILFGSYARGNWVEEYEDDGIHFRYQSDFDLLAIVRTRSVYTQNHLESKIHHAIEEELPDLRTPVSIIIHDIEFINRSLAEAHYFFSDIKKEGIILYDSHKYQLAEAHQLSHAERYRLAKEDFDYYFEAAEKSKTLFQFSFENQYYNEAAFLLHQVTEKLYTTILLVFTRYKPNTHQLQKLRSLAKTIDPRFAKVFPFNNQEEGRCFELLCEAYVGARYKKSYAITKTQLEWLALRVAELEKLTKTLCQEKMQNFLEKNKA